MTTSSTLTYNVEQIRQDFPFLAVHHPSGHPLTYLDNGASTQHPCQVLEAMQACYESAYANVHRGVHYLSEEATSRYESARERIGRFLNAFSSEEIVFTPGCTAAINLVAHGWGRKFLTDRDSVLISQMEHHANIVPWFQLKQARGTNVVFTKITDDGKLDMQDFQEKLSQRPKLIAITAVSNVLGTVNPLREIIELAHDAGAKVLIDAAQAVPHHAIDVTSLDCDFLVFSGHKMLGPSGIGVLYAKMEHLEAMDPFMGGGGMIDIVSEEGFTSGMVPAKFEAGTPPIVEAVGLAAAADYLQQVGLTLIESHELSLTKHAYEGLAQIDGLRILGPDANSRGGIISFVMDRVHAHDIAQVLDSFGIAVRPGHHCTMPLHEKLGIAASARASFYLYNTLEEVDRLISAVRSTKERFEARGRHRST